MERKLATIRRISSISPIENADAIELAKVDGWQVVVKKGEFKEGDLCTYAEIDSILDPDNPAFEFMRPRHFRVRTIKLRGQLSQGIVFPMSILGNQYLWGEYQVGDDVTDVLKIVKWEPNIPASLAGKIKGNFPSFLRKTDEERIQNLTDVYENYKKHTFWVTEKLDGSSVTYYYNNGVFGVCSRNIDLLETPENTFWKVARALKIEEKLKSYCELFGHNFAFQGELIGNGIQGNKYGYEANTVRFYNVFNIDNQAYEPMWMFQDTIESLGLKTVPILSQDYTLPPTVDELLKYAEGKSALNKNTEREGLVLRNETRTISFKVISNKFLLKNDE